MLRVSAVVDLALDCLFPRICVGCGRLGRYICAGCEAHMAFLVGPLCPRCGQPQASGMLCPSCAKTQSSSFTIRSVFRFEGTARRAIHELKYHNLRSIAPTLAVYLATYDGASMDAPDVIVPVPLHPAREKRRGYNQAALLAREVGRLTGVPVSPRSLKRTREGASQVRTSGMDERRRNVLGAFSCTDTCLEGKRIMLIDDVCTTGATLEACASALAGAGVREVCGLTLAREV